ncbi:hypothetical protein ACLOJK_030141 [Asimina triloba]
MARNQDLSRVNPMCSGIRFQDHRSTYKSLQALPAVSRILSMDMILEGDDEQQQDHVVLEGSHVSDLEFFGWTSAQLRKKGVGRLSSFISVSS